MKTNKNILNIALCALLALALPGMATAQQLKMLGGHVPSVLSRFHLQPIGELPGDTNLNLAISLPVKNEAGLNALLSQIYDPSSTNYHHFLKRGEFVQRFGPSAADYQKVLDFAKGNNLEVVRSYSNQMLLDVRGKASDIESAFHVKFHTYRHPSENRTFFAPDSDPSVDSSMPIEHVSGLDSYYTPRSALVNERNLTQNVPAGTKFGVGSGPFGLYQGKDFRAAYVPGVTLDGTGQNVALFELDGYYSSDITAYEGAAGLPTLTLTNILVDGGPPTISFGGDVEVSLDIEMVISMATNVSEVIVYEAPNEFGSPVVDELNRIASDDLANQISSSWLIGDDPSFDVYYKQMALQGQTFLQCSGDNGAYFTNQEQDQEWADDTNVTIVGGTTLSTTGQGAWSSETVWNQFSAGNGQDGSGGGTNWNGIAMPSWQQNVSMTNNQGSKTLRNVPDVALTAENIYVIADQGFQFGVAGTSAATPLWAAYASLVNEQAASRNRSSVGFLNPAIYAIGMSANYTNCFHDIITGNNTNLTIGNSYSAVPGYDLATGWGTPNGSNLINALTAFPVTNIFTHLSPPSPPYGSTLAVLNGGNPNGNWELFALDDQGFNNGGITNGWILTLTTANPIGNVADDALTMTASATSIFPDTQVQFNLGITNYGPDTSSNVVVLDTLPVGFTLVSTNATLGTIAVAGQNLTWTVTNALAYSIGGQMTLTMQAPNAQEQAVNSALVTPGTPDPNPADVSAEVVVNVAVPTQPLLAPVTAASQGQFHLNISNSQFPVVIQASTNMINWVNLYTNYPPFNTYTDMIAPGSRTRFYRAFVPSEK